LALAFGRLDSMVSPSAGGRLFIRRKPLPDAASSRSI